MWSRSKLYFRLMQGAQINKGNSTQECKMLFHLFCSLIEISLNVKTLSNVLIMYFGP